MRGNNFKDLTGLRFWRLTVIKFHGKSIHNRCSVWECLCDCGNIKYIRSDKLSLTNSKKTKSCGCLQRDITIKRQQLPKGVAVFNKILKYYKKNARNRNLVFDLTKEEFKKLIVSKCFYCNCNPERKSTSTSGDILLFNGVDRVDNELGYTKENCKTCCYLCNSFKSKFSKEIFLEHVIKIYNYNNKI